MMHKLKGNQFLLHSINQFILNIFVTFDLEGYFVRNFAFSEAICYIYFQVRAFQS